LTIQSIFTARLLEGGGNFIPLNSQSLGEKPISNLRKEEINHRFSNALLDFKYVASFQNQIALK